LQSLHCCWRGAYMSIYFRNDSHPPSRVYWNIWRGPVFSKRHICCSYFSLIQTKKFERLRLRYTNRHSNQPGRFTHVSSFAINPRTRQLFSKWENTWILMYRRYILNWRRVMYTELAVPRTHTFGSTYIHNTLRHGSLYNGTPNLSVYTSSPFVLVNKCLHDIICTLRHFLYTCMH
jgi:hypothetical protein